jgi:hypothetical protein
MITPEIFEELQNIGLITRVGLKSEDFKDLNELQQYGIVSNTDSNDIYEAVVKKIEEQSNYIEVFLQDIANGGKVTLKRDVTLAEHITIKNSVELDLNGHTILHPATTSDPYKDVLEVMTGGKLIINGEGSVIAEDGYSVYAAGDAVVEINGGYYFSPVTAVDVRKNAHVTINNGTFKVDGSNNPDGNYGQKFTLNLRDKKGNYVSDQSEITVKGGKFYKYDPSKSESETPIANFVAAGYESVQEGDWYVVKESKEIVVDEGK